MINIEKQSNAYSLLFIIENKLRVSMHNILVKKMGVEYFDRKFLPEFEYEINGIKQKIDFIEKVKIKKKEEPKYKIDLGFDYPYLWYTEYSELVILLDQHWTGIFSEIFLQPKSTKVVFIPKAFNIIKIRNAIAHNRYIDQLDYSDLQAFESLIKGVIKQDYLKNYNELVFNRLESIKIEFEKRTREIERKLIKGEFISRDILRNWRSQFSAILPNLTSNSVLEFENYYKELENYNKKLPSKPGRMENIRSYISEKKLLETIKVFKLI